LQFNPIVGNLFRVKDDYGQYGDLAQELIVWFCSKTHVLALLRELQLSTMGKTVAIIRTVLTRWLLSLPAIFHPIQAVADEESVSASESEIMHAAADPSDFQRIPIKDLFDFSRAEDWLGFFFHTDIRGLDAEIELYELLDLDAEGIDDPEFPQADEILDE
jgi:hypothetical protein